MRWLSMVLLGLIGYGLLAAIALRFWSIRAHRFQQLETNGNRLEAILRRWLEDSGQTVKITPGTGWNFELLTTIPDGESIYVVLMKEHQRFITFRANLDIPPEQEAILKAMPGTYFEKLEQELVLRGFLAKMVLNIRTRLSEITLISQLAIADLTEDTFFKHIDELENAILLARKIIFENVERAPRLVAPRQMRRDEHG